MYVYLLCPIITYLAISFIHKLFHVIFVRRLFDIYYYKCSDSSKYIYKKLIYPLQFTLFCKIDLNAGQRKKIYLSKIILVQIIYKTNIYFSS